MNHDDDLLPALVRLATLQRESVDRLALAEAVEASRKAGDARRRLAELAGHLGLAAPRWQDEADPACVPALAACPDGRWAILLGQNTQQRWIVAQWDPAARQWREEAAAQLDGWRFARLRFALPFALERSPVFALIKAEMLRHKRLLLEAGIGGLVIGLIGLVTSFYSMQIYNRVIPTGALQTLWVLSLGALMAALLEWLARNARAHLYEQLIDSVDQRLARAVYLRLLSVRLDQMPTSVGSMAGQIRGYETVRAFLTQGAGTVLVDAPFAFIFLGCIVWIGGALAFIPLLFFVFAIAAGLSVRRPMEAAGRLGARAGNLKTGLLVETIEGAETIKSGQGGWRMLGSWLDNTGKARGAELASRRLSERFQHLMMGCQQVSYLLLVATGAYLVSRSELTMGGLVACTILAGRVLNPISLIANQTLQWSQAKAALEGLDHIWRLEDDHHGHEPVLLDRIAGHYRFDNVSARYGSLPALAVPRLEIRPGERIGVIGPVGAGKTTLLRLLSGMYKPQEGRILIDDVDLAQVAKPALAGHIGYLQQEGRLFAGTLRENLLLGQIDPGDEAILDAARRTGLMQAVIASHPRGLQREIHEGGGGLSGGQRQLVNLTRVLLRKPRIWLLDEPTAALDGNTERQVIALLQDELGRGATVVMVTHKPDMLQLVDRLIVIADHQIVADGATAQVLARLQAPVTAVNFPHKAAV